MEIRCLLKIQNICNIFIIYLFIFLQILNNNMYYKFIQS